MMMTHDMEDTMTDLNELATLRTKARALGHCVTLYFNEAGRMDQVYIRLRNRESKVCLYDPLSAAELLRKVTR